MKFQLQIVCLFALFSVVFTSLTEEEKKVAESCKKETGASDDDMKILNDFVLPTTKTQYCLLACSYKATGTMDADNKLVYEKTVAEIEPLKKDLKDAYDKLTAIFKDCIATTTPEKDQCDSVKKYFECIEKRSKDLGIEQ